MKKFVSIVLALLMVLSLVACGGDKTPTTSDGTSAGTSAGTSSGTTTPSTGDGSGTTPTTPVDPDAWKYGGELNVRWNTLEKGLDPHIYSGWGFYHWALCVFENAIAQDAEGNFVPGVCDFEFNEDQTVLKLKVREGKKFHNGKDVTIEDVVASLDRASLQSNIKKYFTDYVESVEVKDGVATYTFKEYVANTMYYLTGYFTYTSIMPKEICEKYGKDAEKAINTVADCIGTGPYKVVEYVEDTQVVMERFDDYCILEGSTGPATKYAYMDKITIHCNKDDTSAMLALFAGDYDVCRLSGAEYLTMAEKQGIVKFDERTANNVYIPFNTKGSRPVNDVNLRKAIAAVMSEPDVVPGLRSVYKLEHCPIQGKYYTTKFNEAEYYAKPGVETAKKYLAQSNYNGEELVFLVNGSADSYALVCKDKCAQIGVNVRIEYVDSGIYKSTYSDPKNAWDMCYLTSAVGSYVPGTLAANLRSTFWGNKKAQELFTATASNPFGSDASMKAWDELSDLWVEDCPNMILCYGTSVWGRNPELNDNVPEGVTFNYWYNTYWEKK